MWKCGYNRLDIDGKEREKMENIVQLFVLSLSHSFYRNIDGKKYL
jgi:hypothetical protein